VLGRTGVYRRKAVTMFERHSLYRNTSEEGRPQDFDGPRATLFTVADRNGVCLGAVSPAGQIIEFQLQGERSCVRRGDATRVTDFVMWN